LFVLPIHQVLLPSVTTGQQRNMIISHESVSSVSLWASPRTFRGKVPPCTCVLNGPDSDLVPVHGHRTSPSWKLGQGWIKIHISLDLTRPLHAKFLLTLVGSWMWETGKTEAGVLLQEPLSNIPQ